MENDKLTSAVHFQYHISTERVKRAEFLALFSGFFGRACIPFSSQLKKEILTEIVAQNKSGSQTRTFLLTK